MPSHPGETQSRNLWLGLQGMNGNLLCAVDVETTGLDYNQHEIWQLCVLPLNPMLEPNKAFLPFYMSMKPERMDNIDPKAAKLGLTDLTHLLLKALPTDRVQDYFVEWFEKLNLAPGKKIVPVAHNFFFDRSMLMKWLGQDLYDSIFHFHPRDTMVTAAFLNDRADSGCRDLPYTRLGLKNVCSKHNIEIPNAHDALADCIATAQLYAALCRSSDMI